MSEERRGIPVVDNPAESRYEARTDDGAVAGVTHYLRAPGVIAVTHTEVAPEFEGQGVGSALSQRILQAAQEAGEKVAPVCPYFAGYLRKHPEYQPLVYRKD